MNRCLILALAFLLYTIPAQAQRFGGAIALTPEAAFVAETGNAAFPGSAIRTILKDRVNPSAVEEKARQ